MSKMLRMRKDLGVTPYSPVIPLSFEFGLEPVVSNSKPLPETANTAWQQITSKIQQRLNRHEKYWWQISGYALAVLLQAAGYTHAAQVKILEFFAGRIVSSLGIANQPGAQRWKSFMTDDNNPIELSWDWHIGADRPSVRFSIEPIGPDAGTPEDPRNERAAAEFKQSIVQTLPETDMLWFDHFDTFFREGVDCSSVEGHSSKVFWAFDLGEKDITSKAYFFPGYRAKATKQTNLQVITQAIESAPLCTPEKLGAFNMFAEFVNEYEELGGAPLELDMLAIDMIDCSKSRLKIYFRNRRTDFRSVCETMSLGRRVTNQEMDLGLKQLRRLWDSLFDHEGTAEDTPLGQADHRTAGILYNVEFRLGSQVPKAKIYIPVRHYARSDAQVMMSVSRFMDSQGSAIHSREQRETGKNNDDNQPGQPVEAGTEKKGVAPAERRRVSQISTAYAKAFSTIFTDEAVSGSRGLHTYIACSVQTGGTLRVVSYINPQEEKLRRTPPLKLR
ncbi:hypothetical protein AAE478_001595 [Parahypoxylon ruwenzoriense]